MSFCSTSSATTSLLLRRLITRRIPTAPSSPLRSIRPSQCTHVRSPLRTFTSVPRAGIPQATLPRAARFPLLRQTRTYASASSSGKAPKKDSDFPFWPLVAIFFGGSGLFYFMVQQRKGDPAAAKPYPLLTPRPDSPASLPSPEMPTPAFSADDITVIFVLGGPGAGKGTQCANLVRDYDFVHLSAGDLLRAEQAREGSEFGELIKTYITEGKIVPMEVTVALLENAMRDAIEKRGKSKFLIDGFPRKLDQAYKFESSVCPSKLVLFFDTSEEIMLQRLMKRSETSGRDDDNITSIRKRFRTFIETSMPVVDYYEKLGKVVKIDASKAVDGVYETVKKELEGKLGK